MLLIEMNSYALKIVYFCILQFKCLYFVTHVTFTDTFPQGHSRSRAVNKAMWDKQYQVDTKSLNSGLVRLAPMECKQSNVI